MRLYVQTISVFVVYIDVDFFSNYTYPTTLPTYIFLSDTQIRDSLWSDKILVRETKFSYTLQSSFTLSCPIISDCISLLLHLLITVSSLLSKC